MSDLFHPMDSAQRLLNTALSQPTGAISDDKAEPEHGYGLELHEAWAGDSMVGRRNLHRLAYLLSKLGTKQTPERTKNEQAVGREANTSEHTKPGAEAEFGTEKHARGRIRAGVDELSTTASLNWDAGMAADMEKATRGRKVPSVVTGSIGHQTEFEPQNQTKERAGLNPYSASKEETSIDNASGFEADVLTPRAIPVVPVSVPG